MTDRLDAHVRHALRDILDLAPPAGARATAPARQRTPEHDPRRRAVLAATAVVAVAGVGGIAVMELRDAPGGVRRAPSSSLPPVDPPATTLPPEQPIATSAPTGSTADAADLAGLPGWYLPSYVPAGYQIAELSGDLAMRPASVPRRWLRPAGPDGTGAALVSVEVVAPTTGETRTPSGSHTIHGLPAHVVDSGEGIVAAWQEGGVVVSLRAVGMSEAETVAAAEALRVDATATTATFDEGSAPAGFAPVQPDGLAPDDAVSSTILLLPSGAATGGFVSAAVRPNHGNDTIDTMLVEGSPSPVSSFEVRPIGGITRLVQSVDIVDTGDPQFTSVTWVDDGLVVSVSGRLERDELLAFAQGFEPAAFADVLAAGAQITARTLAMEVLDAATFTDGTRVTVRTNGNGAAALCVEAPVQRCVRHTSESSLGGEAPEAIVEGFTLGGEQVVLGWRSGDGTPEVVVPGLTPGDPGTTAAVDDLVRTAVGHFALVRVPDGQDPPQVRYPSGDGWVIHAVSPDRPAVDF